jgi:hypothetical protein
MTIEIQKPELEALIVERVRLGAFPTVEDALWQALNSSPPPFKQRGAESNGAPGRTGADLIDVMQASPYRDIELEPARDRFPVRDITF